jgi:hypothetical protein
VRKVAERRQAFARSRAGAQRPRRDVLLNLDTLKGGGLVTKTVSVNTLTKTGI